MIQDRTPVIVGVAHAVQRSSQPDDIVDAVVLMIRALEDAGRDAGTSASAPALLSKLDTVMVVQGLWRWPDPARLVADAVGAPGARTVLAPACGSTPQVCVGVAAERILAGTADVVAVCGGEWVHGRSVLRGLGLPRVVTPQRDGRPDEVGEAIGYESDLERERGFEKPLVMYPMMESALRHHRGETLADNTSRIAKLISDLSAVASTNPHAWLREAWSPDDIAATSEANPMVAFPYTKRMVSNPKVDMASAVIMTSVGTARALGIESDRWVFPLAAAQLVDPHFFSELDRYEASANVRLVGRGALGHAGLGMDDVAVLDLYSCFPSALQIEADALDVSVTDGRPLTVSGGMASFGGPIANYVGHVLVDMVDQLRDRPGEVGCCVANGGYLNRPAVGVYATRPPDRPFARADLSDAAAHLPHREVVATVDGPCTIESVTALYFRGTEPRGLATGLTSTGHRTLAWTVDDTLLDAICTEELVGRIMTTDADGRIVSVA